MWKYSGWRRCISGPGIAFAGGVAATVIVGVLVSVIPRAWEQDETATDAIRAEMWSISAKKSWGAVRITWTRVSPPHAMQDDPRMMRVMRDYARVYSDHRALADVAPRWSEFRGREGVLRSPSDDLVVEDARGWPFLAFRCTARASRIGQGGAGATSVNGGLLIRAAASGLPADMQLLPLTPLWPGFIANSGLFGSALTAVYYGVRGIIRRYRLRRGECPNCGYPASASNICSECGAIRCGG